MVVLGFHLALRARRNAAREVEAYVYNAQHDFGDTNGHFGGAGRAPHRVARNLAPDISRPVANFGSANCLAELKNCTDSVQLGGPRCR